MKGSLGKRMAMPLLGKELTELAARPRTYVLRVVYAVLLFSGFFYSREYGYAVRSGGFLQDLGAGRAMLEALLQFQFCGIYLFLPAMMSQTIAEEKEKESLALLFLTDMGPWELLWQKYLGRLIPMFSFLLLSVPLMAIAYSYGGFSSDYLVAGVWMLFLACLQVGAFALMCSAYCRTPMGAFLLSYLGGAMFYFVPWLVAALLRDSLYSQGYPEWLADSFNLFPPQVFLEHAESGGFFAVLARSWPIVLSTVSFLFAARLFLTRRAFGVSRNWFVSCFGLLDRVLARWNTRCGGYVLWKVGGGLPEDDPVAWLELKRRALGQRHHFIRILLLIEVPAILFAMFWGCLDGNWGSGRTGFLYVVWAVAALVLVVQGSSVIAVERTHQTLDVLLGTPVLARDIVLQKMRALRRVWVLLAVPFVTFAVMPFCFAGGSAEDWVRVLHELMAVVVFPPLLLWGSMWIGMRARTRFRGIMTALIALIVYCVVPVLVGELLGGVGRGISDTVWCFSPLWYLDVRRYSDPEVVEALLYALPHVGMACVFRALCLRRANWYLRKESTIG